KERFMALPGLETIGFTEQGPWQFPERTVLVKTFTVDTPAGKKRIETRFLTLQQGEWYGYSYAWNAEQTDAVLVEAEGRDHAITVREARTSKETCVECKVCRADTTTDIKKSMVWRYPSRVECMVCHSRAASFV